MTTHADGMTAAGDDSRRSAGVTGASGDRATFQVQPGTLDGFDIGTPRRRKSPEIDLEPTFTANVFEHAQPDTMTCDMVSPTNATGGLSVEMDDDQPVMPSLKFDDHETDGRAIVMDPTNHQKQAFEVIRRVRKLIGEADAQEETTHAQYTTIARRLEKMLGHPLDQPGSTRCLELLDRYARRQTTFRLYKSAVLWFLRQPVRRALAEQDQLQRSGQHGDPWIEKVMVLGQMAAEYRKIKDHKGIPPEVVEGMPELENHSKRLDLKIIKKRYEDWDERMLDGAIGKAYANVVRAMRLVGPRPAEFVKGVVVDLEPTGEASIKIQGAKVDGVRGQPWRKIFFPLVDLPPEWQHRLQDLGSFVVSIHSTGGLRKALERISRRMLPNVPIASAYVFRHSIATRLRKQGFSSAEIGGFLGHSAAETQSTYGFKSAQIRGGKKMRETSSIRISVPRAVRLQDKSGLTKVINSRPPKMPRSRPP